MPDQGRDVLLALRRRMDEQLQDLKAGEPMAVALSGGIDSTVAARLLLDSLAAVGRSGDEVRAACAGFDGCADFTNAVSAAGILGLRLETVVMQRDSIEMDAGDIAAILEGTGIVPTIMNISFSLPLYHAARHLGASRMGKDGKKIEECKRVPIVTGQGADELFGGYARYARMAPGEAASATAADYKALQEVGIRGDEAIAARWGCRLVLPFVSKELGDLVASVPPENRFPEKCGERVSKHLLRTIARSMGLPEEIAGKPKKAAQYGSMSQKVLEDCMRRSGLERDAYIASLMENAGKNNTGNGNGNLDGAR